MDDITVRYNFKYDSVIVIQSLLPNEPETGKELFNDIIRRRCERNGTRAHYISIQTKNEFFQELYAIKAQVLAGTVSPILHMEIHGGRKGLELGNGEVVLWEELAGIFREMNRALKNGLIISLATCQGAYMYKLTDIQQTAPYWGFIGPKDIIRNENFTRDFSGFYDLLLETHDLGKALDALNINNETYLYAFLTAEMIFDLVVEEIDRRPKEKSVETFRRLFSRTKKAFPDLNRSQRRQQLKHNQNVHNRSVFLAKLKRDFLMK